MKASRWGREGHRLERRKSSPRGNKKVWFQGEMIPEPRSLEGIEQMCSLIVPYRRYTSFSCELWQDPGFERPLLRAGCFIDAPRLEIIKEDPGMDVRNDDKTVSNEQMVGLQNGGKLPRKTCNPSAVSFARLKASLKGAFRGSETSVGHVSQDKSMKSNHRCERCTVKHHSESLGMWRTCCPVYFKKTGRKCRRNAETNGGSNGEQLEIAEVAARGDANRAEQWDMKYLEEPVDKMSAREG